MRNEKHRWYTIIEEESKLVVSVSRSGDHGRHQTDGANDDRTSNQVTNHDGQRRYTSHRIASSSWNFTGIQGT